MTGITVQSKEVRDAIGLHSGKYSKFTRQLDYLGIYEVVGGVLSVYKNEQLLSFGPSSAVNDNKTPEYYFKLPPRTYDVTDPFATTIIPAQNNSKFVERYGTFVREVKLSGTTGLRPSRNFIEGGNSLKLFGFDTGITGPVKDVAEFAGLGHTPDVGGALSALANVFTQKSPWVDGEALGLDDIIFLRNMFRLFAHLQTQEDTAGRYVMIWRNIRDAEYWFVEPTEFRLSMDKGSPLTYEYNIALKLVSPYDYTVKLEDDKSLLSSLRELAMRIDQAANTFRQGFVYLSMQIDRFARLPLSLTNMVLNPLREVLTGLEAVTKSVGNFKQNFKSACKKALDSWAEFLSRCGNLLDPQDPAMNAIRKVKRVAEKLYTYPGLQPDDTGERIRNALSPATSSATAGNPVPGSTVPSATDPFRPLINQGPYTIKSADVYPNDTIHSLAHRLLGDASKFPIIAAVNSLQSPYISKRGGIGVLRPGDKVMYPVPGADPTSRYSSNGKTPEEAAYKTDLKVAMNANGKLDLVKSATGSLTKVTGVDNVVQAITMKFHVTHGGLHRHPKYGSAAEIGSKATASNLAGIRLDTEQTLASDPRVESISQLNFLTRGDVLFVNAKINIVKASNVLNVTVPLRT